MRPPPEKRPIVLVTSLLGGGGAERILLTMAEWWVRRGRRVAVLALRDDVPTGSAYPLPAGVEIVRLGLISERNPFWQVGHLQRLRRLRRALVRLEPWVVMPFLDKLNIAVLLALRGTGIQVVATEHLAPWHNPLGAGWEALRRWTYPRARAVVSPTERISTWLRSRMRGCFETLPSPAMNLSLAPTGERRPLLLAAGRLAYQKGFDRLIPVAAVVLRRHPGWSLEIAGEGPERNRLRRQIEELGMSGRIRLLGAVADLPSRLRRAAVFVLSSRHEAYPMVVCEALAAGCAVLASDCETGPREILGDPPAGWLIPEGKAADWEQALEQVVVDAARREWLQRAALGRAPELQAERIMPLWEQRLLEWAGA